jgi:hypothetical protein
MIITFPAAEDDLYQRNERPVSVMNWGALYWQQQQTRRQLTASDPSEHVEGRSDCGEAVTASCQRGLASGREYLQPLKGKSVEAVHVVGETWRVRGVGGTEGRASGSIR